MNTTLHLIPVSLGDSAVSTWMPEDVRKIAQELTLYIAENAKTARAFLKQIETLHPIQAITIHTLNKQTSDEDIHHWLNSVPEHAHIGLVSEAGCPAVADPGARVVRLAHNKNILIKPWVGPSSILLGLMASGLDGQRFCFQGYAPTDTNARKTTLKQWESVSKKQQQTQILIETPYRNMAMFEALLETLTPTTDLCIAHTLTTANEWIKTQTIHEWRHMKGLDLNGQPCLFLFLAR